VTGKQSIIGGHCGVIFDGLQTILYPITQSHISWTTSYTFYTFSVYICSVPGI